MKNLTLAIIIISTLGSSHSAYATEIFRCVDENAQISFSFSSCPDELVVDHYEEPILTIEERTSQLETIDEEISRLKRQFRDLRLEQEYSLQSVTDTKTASQIREDYQSATQDLLDQLFALKAKRGELVQGSVALLSQTQS